MSCSVHEEVYPLFLTEQKQKFGILRMNTRAPRNVSFPLPALRMPLIFPFWRICKHWSEVYQRRLILASIPLAVPNGFF